MHFRRFFLSFRATEPLCGRCGYPARDWTGNTCPECGTDKRRVPLAVPKRSRRIMVVVGWAVLMGLCTFLAIGTWCSAWRVTMVKECVLMPAGERKGDKHVFGMMRVSESLVWEPFQEHGHDALSEDPGLVQEVLVVAMDNRYGPDVALKEGEETFYYYYRDKIERHQRFQPPAFARQMATRSRCYSMKTPSSPG